MDYGREDRDGAPDGGAHRRLSRQPAGEGAESGEPEDLPPDADSAGGLSAGGPEQGLAPRTINARMSVWNSYCQYIGRREWVQEEFFRNGSEVQPELTRTEYLRLLQTAKILGREKSYLLIKTLGGAGLRIQELPQLTVEAVRQGTVGLRSHNNLHRRLLRIPASLREELLDYIRQRSEERRVGKELYVSV